MRERRPSSSCSRSIAPAMRESRHPLAHRSRVLPSRLRTGATRSGSRLSGSPLARGRSWLRRGRERDHGRVRGARRALGWNGRAPHARCGEEPLERSVVLPGRAGLDVRGVRAARRRAARRANRHDRPLAVRASHRVRRDESSARRRRGVRRELAVVERGARHGSLPPPGLALERAPRRSAFPRRSRGGAIARGTRGFARQRPCRLDGAVRPPGANGDEQVVRGLRVPTPAPGRYRLRVRDALSILLDEEIVLPEAERDFVTRWVSIPVPTD